MAPPAPDSQATGQAPPTTVPLSPAEVHRVVIGAMTALFLSALDQTIVATALPTMGADLGNFELISWVVTSYLLTSTVATPVLGKLSDLHGRRPIMRICIAVFLLGSVLSALADSMLMLILARALQGLGGGGLITMAQTIVADVVEPRERGRYSAYFSGVWAGSALLGPTLGGFLTQYISWHWIFWINLPIGLAALLFTDRILARLHIHRAEARIDYLSILFFTVSTTALLLFLSLGGTSFAWISLPSAAAFLVFLLFGVVFAWRQRHVAQPIIPPHFLADGVIRPVLAAIFLIFGVYLAIAVLSPTFFQVALQSPASEVGLLMIPFMISATITAFLAGRHVSRTGRYKKPPLLSLPIAVVALLVLAEVADSASPLLAASLLFFVGLGIGPIFPITVVAAQNVVTRQEMGAISGAISLARSLGGAVATAAASALVLGLILVWLPQVSGLAGLEDLVRQPLDSTERGQVANAFSVLFVAAAVVLAIGMAIFALVEQRPLRGRARPVEGPEAV